MISYPKKISCGGYSLIEVLIAITILLLSIVVPMTIASKGIKSGAFVGEQTTAIFLAQEGIESVVAIRNEAMFQTGALDTEAVWDWVTNPNSVATNFSSCFTNSGCNISWNSNLPRITVTACSGINPCQLQYNPGSGRSPYQIGMGDPTPYERVIQLTNNGDEVEVISTVSWNSRLFGTVDRTVELRTTLFKLYGENF